MLSIAAAERQYLKSDDLLSDTEQSLKVTVQGSFGRHEGRELTSWPPALGLLRYLIVISTIYRICMGLSLRHCPTSVHMSAFRTDAPCWKT